MRLPRLVLTAALCASSFLPSACATRSPRGPAVPDAPVEEPRPQACAPEILLAAKPEPPVRGAIVRPQTPEERAATAEFLGGEAEARAWGREGWARAETARKDCLRRQGPP